MWKLLCFPNADPAFSPPPWTRCLSECASLANLCLKPAPPCFCMYVRMSSARKRANSDDFQARCAHSMSLWLPCVREERRRKKKRWFATTDRHCCCWPAVDWPDFVIFSGRSGLPFEYPLLCWTPEQGQAWRASSQLNSQVLHRQRKDLFFLSCQVKLWATFSPQRLYWRNERQNWSSL